MTENHRIFGSKLDVAQKTLQLIRDEFAAAHKQDDFLLGRDEIETLLHLGGLPEEQERAGFVELGGVCGNTSACMAGWAIVADGHRVGYSIKGDPGEQYTYPTVDGKPYYDSLESAYGVTFWDVAALRALGMHDNPELDDEEQDSLESWLFTGSTSHEEAVARLELAINDPEKALEKSDNYSSITSTPYRS